MTKTCIEHSTPNINRCAAPWFVVFLLICVAAGKNESDPLVDDAAAAARNGKLEALAEKLRPQLVEALEGKKPDLPEITHLATVWRFATYFGRLREMDQSHRDALAWVIQQPRFAEELLLGATDYDPPDRVLEIIRTLRDGYARKMEQRPEIAAAFALVWDAPERFGGEEDAKIDSAQVRHAFARVMSIAERSARMPVQLSVYAVDLDLDDEQVAWARQRYPAGDVSYAFFDVPFDQGIGYDPAKKGDDDAARTLMNIWRRGAGSVDAAWYAAQVGKATGLPTAICRAEGAVGGAIPAWAAFVTPAGRWDVTSAKRADHDEWSSEILDPQTYETIGEDELAMAADFSRMDRARRVGAMAVLKGAGAVQLERRADVHLTAIEMAPSNREAWDTLGELVAKGAVTESCRKRFDDLFKQHVLRRWPGFGLRLRLQMMRGQTIGQQHKMIEATEEMFRDRPRLYARAKIAEGDLFRDDKRRGDAVAAYGDAMMKCAGDGAIAVAALSRIDPILYKEQEFARLLEIYRRSFEGLKQPRPSAWARTTAWFMIGDRYAGLLDETGQAQMAQRVRAQLANVQLAGEEKRRLR